MSKLDCHNLRVVLYEGPGAAPLPEEERFGMISSLLAEGFEVARPAEGQPLSGADGSPILVLGRFDGRAPEIRGAEVRNIDGTPAALIAREVRDNQGLRRLGEWKPWFPVIDYDRCTNCMQCLTFCLFDVYGLDENKKITVQNQINCKTECPACSRVCPEVAIMFPKHAKGPINGDVVRDEDIQREAMKVDISALLGGDLYGALRKRTEEARKRFSTERDPSKALLERKRCLKELGKDLDIPDEVLMTLPSAEDIEERAKRAAAKTAARQARSQTLKDARPAPTEKEWGI